MLDLFFSIGGANTGREVRTDVASREDIEVSGDVNKGHNCRQIAILRIP